MKSPKTVWFFLLAVLFSGCGDVVFDNPLDPNASRDELRLLRSVGTPAVGEGDIDHDGEKIWKADPSGTLLAVEPLSGTVLRSLNAGRFSGLAWLDGELLVCHAQSNLLRSFDPLSGSLVRTIGTGAYFFRLIAAQGRVLIGYDERSGHLVRFDPETGAGQMLFKPGGLNPGGLTVLGDRLLLSEINSQSVFVYDGTGQILAVYRSPVQNIRGICVDPRSQALYLCTLNGTLSQVQLP